QFKSADAWPGLDKLGERDGRAVADVCTGLRSPESGEFLLRHLERVKEGTGNWTRYALHVARYVPGTAKGNPFLQLLKLARANVGNDLGVQAAVFKSAYQGLQARGGTPDANALGLYEDLTHGLLASKDAGQQQAGVELAGLVKIK